MASSPLRLALPLTAALAVALVVALVVAGALAAAPAPAAGDPRLAQAQAAIDAGMGRQALALVDAHLKDHGASGEALLLRSTADVLVGDVAGAYDDLKKALRLDPALRQGWLNLAGLEIAERDYQAATKALTKARELDPAAPDTYLNQGAIELLQGQADAARAQFTRYLELSRGDAEAHFLVAANYAITGREDQAVEHLAAAVERDERMRLRARQDDRFASLTGAGYVRLLTTDAWRAPDGAPQVAAAFRMPYQRRDPKLLYAVLDALRAVGVPYEPGIEATEEWALLWAEGMRIKLYNQGDGTGVVSVTARDAAADRDRFTARSQELFRAVHGELSAIETSPARNGRG